MFTRQLMRNSDGGRGVQPSVSDFCSTRSGDFDSRSGCTQSMSESLVSTVMRVAITSPTMCTSRFPDVSY